VSGDVRLEARIHGCLCPDGAQACRPMAAGGGRRAGSGNPPAHRKDLRASIGTRVSLERRALGGRRARGPGLRS
jgi:hypothetical protein